MKGPIEYRNHECNASVTKQSYMMLFPAPQNKSRENKELGSFVYLTKLSLP